MTCQAMLKTRQPAMPAPGRRGRARRDAASGTVSAASGTVSSDVRGTPAMPGVPWWGIVSAIVAPVLLISGWTFAAGLQRGTSGDGLAPALGGARLLGLLAEPAAAEAHFGKTLSDPAGGAWPFERAQLQPDYGEWLRRQRRINDAKPVLAAALETCRRRGAGPWMNSSLTARPASCATCRPISRRTRSPMSCACLGTPSAPIGATCTPSSASTPAARRWTAPAPWACSRPPPEGLKAESPKLEDADSPSQVRRCGRPRSREAGPTGRVRARVEGSALTGAAGPAWNGDLPRLLQQVLFDTANSITF